MCRSLAISGVIAKNVLPPFGGNGELCAGEFEEEGGYAGGGEGAEGGVGDVAPVGGAVWES
jgi:hypothetical protein